MASKKKAFKSGSKPNAGKTYGRVGEAAEDWAQRIRVFDDPILSETCEEVSEDEAKNLGKYLRDSLAKQRTGVGLAAPQIAFLKRAVLIKPERRLNGTLMFNPTILKEADRYKTAVEGCLSYPVAKGPMFTTMVKRPVFITVQFWDVQWHKRIKSYAGFHARIVCHELDHLDGICLVGDAWREAYKAKEDERKASSQTK